ncbi:hypothetical protein L4C34_03320 [Vibrio profundum]|uniref:hypothetical protein n=1 Tax=Vibrio profundum TaxID=2910247 RepID=UPI003D106D25
MNQQQFEFFKAQLNRLTTQQLHTLQGEIRSRNEVRRPAIKPAALLTEEEINVISSLFA